jgi:hypothetical protein
MRPALEVWRTGLGDLGLAEAMLAVAWASRFAAPQRALACAAAARRREMLVLRLGTAGAQRELNVLEVFRDGGANAIWRAPPCGATLLTDAAFVVAMREALAVPVLSAKSMRCCTHFDWANRKKCPIVAAAERREQLDADRHARTCKRGGLPKVVHNACCGRLLGVARSWGLAVVAEAGDFLPGALKIDLLVEGCGRGGALLAVDFTRIDTDSASVLEAMASRKVLKYAPRYMHDATVCGCAVDYRGRLSAAARRVLVTLAWAGARACGAHPEDLFNEVLFALSHELWQGLAAQYAAVASVNHDVARGVPRPAQLVPSGQRIPARRRSRAFAEHF